MVHNIAQDTMNKFRNQLHFLSDAVTFFADNMITQIRLNKVKVSTCNFGDIELLEMISSSSAFSIEYLYGNVRMVDRYDANEDGSYDVNEVVDDIIKGISDIVDCVIVEFKSYELASQFIHTYMDTWMYDGWISKCVSEGKTKLHYYEGTKTLAIYTIDTEKACIGNICFVENLMNNRYITESNVDNYNYLVNYVS